MYPPKFKRVIQLELNEISYPVLETLMARNELPTFQRINETWQYFETQSETEYDKIEPWIQWVTAHTGKTFEEHQIYRLGDAHNLRHKQIWETLSDHGIESGIIGSMNTLRRDTIGGVFFSDPWSQENHSFPARLRPLWELISSRVKGHATSEIGLKHMVKGLQTCMNLRLPPNIYWKIARQLYEQKKSKLNKWKLAGVFDLFLTEIFRSILRSTNYGFYTLFLNSVAHYQHHYWRNFDRSPFDPNIDYPDIKAQHDPISYGYKVLDQVLRSVLRTVGQDKDTLILVLSGLSQDPYTEKEDIGGMNYYRLKDHEKFTRSLGLASEFEVFPLMSRDWQIKYPDEPGRLRALRTFEGLRIMGERLFSVKESSRGYLFIETKFHKGNSNGAMIKNENGQDICRFHEAFTNIAIKSGHHNGKGYLWISDERFSASMHHKKIPLTSVYAMPLQALGVVPEKLPSSTPSTQNINLSEI